ncbi:hypothetical protein [Oceanicoccus sp. KOV_DT_Chl]|uniref:hypothetical protein n=1 Tax=Oceanicoccus sp. KOV_DT_Chl TaxID=1904639 RepID=UPI0011AF3EFE|nr:hypothetical protein [Oceanicoccus sp. KOV_DT_Chl]
MNNQSNYRWAGCIAGIVLSLGLIAGCSTSDKEATTVPSAAAKENSSGVIPQHQLDTLQQAKDAEALLLKTDEDRRKQLQ